ncbi:MAG: ABC transporter substrate-binding protein [Actinomycetota bacterium]|nr:ABC transporter substrate-binding protein [Actinomycetota bacterium]
MSRTSLRRRPLTLVSGALVTVAALAVAGCAPSDNASKSNAGASSSSANTCLKATLQTQSPGTLTIATDEPVYEPWFVDDKPTNKKGFESAVAYAVATKLGYADADVKWVRAHFDDVISPTPKKFDFDINEFSITDARAKVVDFSTGYYDVTQAVVTVKGSKIAGATTIAALQGAKLGAQKGTTSYDAIGSVVKPSQGPAVFNTNDLAVQALKNKQIDGLVVDLPTALYVAAAQVKGGLVVGQFKSPGTPEQFGLLLGKGSALTSCMSQAVDALRADGTLTQLASQWLTGSNGAPVLQ